MDTPVIELPFDYVSIWVQVHGIPPQFLNREVAEKLCEVVGEVDRSPKTSKMEGGNFIRVRVKVDVNLPLCRGCVFSIEGSKEGWVSFKYERLPNICY